MQSLESVFKKEVDFLDGECDFKGEVKVDTILKKDSADFAGTS